MDRETDIAPSITEGTGGVVPHSHDVFHEWCEGVPSTGMSRCRGGAGAALQSIGEKAPKPDSTNEEKGIQGDVSLGAGASAGISVGSSDLLNIHEGLHASPNFCPRASWARRFASLLCWMYRRVRIGEV